MKMMTKMKNKRRYRVRDMEDIAFEKEYLSGKIHKSEKKLESSFNNLRGTVNTENVIEEAVNNMGGRGDIVSIVLPYLLQYRKEIFSGKWTQSIKKVFNKKTLSFFTTGALIGAATLFYSKYTNKKKGKHSDEQ